MPYSQITGPVMLASLRTNVIAVLDLCKGFLTAVGRNGFGCGGRCSDWGTIGPK